MIGEALAQSAAWLARQPLSRVRVEGAVVRKRRGAAGEALAAVSRRVPLGMVMLSGEAWAAREAALYRALYGLEVEGAGGGELRLPRLPGERLDRWAAAHPAEVGAEAEAALAALARLHGLREVTARGSRSCSHADATARNALRDAATGEVRFFDFETVHPAGRSEEERRVDDVHVLLTSLAAVAGPASFAPLARLGAGVHGGSLREALGRRASGARTLLLRAQAPMSAGWFAGWSRALRDAVG